jgi:predicted nucleic acid-binding Zn finger protein
MTSEDSEYETLLKRFADLGPREKLSRAILAVTEGRVKRHIFVPSGRVLYTVVGRSGDEFIDPEKPFCSCENFFFSVMGGTSGTCYHLIAYKVARHIDRISETRFHDEEFRYFLSLLSSDLLSRSWDKEDKQTQRPSDTAPR